VKGLQDLIEGYDLPFVAYNHGSIVHLETVAPMFIQFPFTIPSYPKDYLNIPNLIKAVKNLKSIKKEIFDRKFAMEEYGAAFMAEGLITIAGSRLYTNLATDEEVIDDAIGRFDNVFKKVEGAKN
jgi:glutamate-1-semialdehyde 2,1-aminomutase